MSERGFKDIKKVVVRGTNWVGDSVITIPALRALRRVLPGAQITLVGRPAAKGLFVDADFIDDFIVYDRRSSFSIFSQIKTWRNKQFDLAILFPSAFEAALIPFLAGVPIRLGYAKEGRTPMLTHPVASPEWRSSKHEVFYYLYLVTALEQLLYRTSDLCEIDPDIAINVSESRRQAAFQVLNSNGVTQDRRIIALCPGSTNSRAKRWPAEYYASLADRLLDEQYQVVLIGAKDEQDVSRDVTSQMHNKPVVMTGQTSIDQLTAILSCVDLLVTNDTGPAHIGAALGTRTLVVFGPTNPLTTRPLSGQAEIIRHPPDCAPCMLRDCPIDHRCMTAITVDEVFEHSQRLLKRSSFEKTVRSLCDSVA